MPQPRCRSLRSDRLVRVQKIVTTGVCSLSLLVAGPVAATPKIPEAPPADELEGPAQQHAAKAVELFDAGSYEQAEASFQRAAYFAPDWRPLHFNLGVLAEAQGKLSQAVHEYETFRPQAHADEQIIVDQRIDELLRRRAKLKKVYHRQLLGGLGLAGLGLAGVAGGAVVMGVYLQRKSAFDKAEKEDPATMATKPNSGLAVASVYMLIFGGLVALAAIVPLSFAMKSRRKLYGVAVGPTQLRWTGAGAVLKF